MPDWTGSHGPRFVTRTAHRQWLLAEALSLIALFRRSAFDPDGGFFTLDTDGRPLAPPADGARVRQLHDTTRLVHCFAIAHLLGLPGAERFVDHGMHFLRTRHRDGVNGGYFQAVDATGARDPGKQAYGHAFVMLAASSAHVIGHPDARSLFEDVTGVLMERFWEEAAGATSEEYSADWRAVSDYRGQNSNMHLTEALMAAHEAFGDRRHLDMAERIAELIIERHARAAGWRVPEHFTSDWRIDRDYAGDPVFRPPGTTPGHALEWSRLLVQLWEAGGREKSWMREAADALFRSTVESAWDEESGGFYYTLDWQDEPERTDRLWWPCAEGIGAAAVLADATGGEPMYELWYRRIWGFVAEHLIDPVHGGWFPELDAALRPTNRLFAGKPDLYHALQACLIPLLPSTASVTRGLIDPGLRVELGR